MIAELKGMVVAVTHFPVKEGKKPFSRVTLLQRIADRADMAMVMMPTEKVPKVDTNVSIPAEVSLFNGRLSVMAI